MSGTQTTHSMHTQTDKQVDTRNRHTDRPGLGVGVSLICIEVINTYITSTLGSLTYVHSDFEFSEFSSGSSSIITASVIILVVGFP